VIHLIIGSESVQVVAFFEVYQ